jgi:hypothetical protein
MLADFAQTYTPTAIIEQLLAIPRAAEVRTATDIAAPVRWLLDNAELSAETVKAEILPILGASKTDLTPSTFEEAASVGFDPWLYSTAAVISAHRGAVDQKVLDAAEALTAFLATVRQERRPQLIIDAEDRPSFATSAPGFYLHLTIDSPNALTWYAVVGSREYYEDGMAFDGRSLPKPLRAVFAATHA